MKDYLKQKGIPTPDKPVPIETQVIGESLFKTYEVNGRQYTDNLPQNALISIPKKQYIEYEQQKEEIERLNNELEYQNIEAGLEIERLNNIINELKWKPIEEYDKDNYDWVLVKYFDGDYECIPCVAEKRFGKWHSIDEKEIQFDVKYFMDIQQIDKLKELKGDSSNE